MAELVAAYLLVVLLWWAGALMARVHWLEWAKFHAGMPGGRAAQVRDLERARACRRWGRLAPVWLAALPALLVAGGRLLRRDFLELEREAAKNDG